LLIFCTFNNAKLRFSLFLSFDCTEPFAQRKPTVPLNILAFSFDFTEPLARRKPNAEPSAFTRRTFAIATPKARQVDAEPSATS